MMRSQRWVLGLALLLAAGCAREPAGDLGDPMPAAGPDDLVLQVAEVGGFRPGPDFADVPTISIYGDGRVITLGPQIDIYPPPALPNVQVTTIGHDDLQRLWQVAKQARIGQKVDYGEPTVTDATSTRFLLRTPDGLVKTEVYALHATGSAAGLTQQQRANRQAPLDLLAALQDLPTTLGKDSLRPDKPYRATAVAAVTGDWPADPNLPQKEIAWPGPPLPGNRPPDSPYGCVTAIGEQAQAVLAAAAQASTATPWRSGEKSWLVQLRPLLPDETDCASLIR